MSTAVKGQGIIELKNPSFEGLPKASTMPAAWQDCGSPGESPPDLHPTGEFGVTTSPQQGISYLGMVTRERDTWESVSQRLTQPMVEGTCYLLDIFICYSDTYKSALSHDSSALFPFNEPIVFQVFGGGANCDPGAELLAESSVIDNTEWLKHSFKLSPKKPYTHIIFQAYYNTPTIFPYNGNILIDNASALRPINCQRKVVERSSSQVPEISFLSPHTKVPNTESRYSVKARIKNIEKSQVVAYLNGERFENFQVDRAKQLLSMEMDMSIGMNILVLKARTSKGILEDTSRIYFGRPGPRSSDASISLEEKPVDNNLELDAATSSQFKRLDFNTVRAGQTVVIENLFFEIDSYSIKQESFENLNDLGEALKDNGKMKIEIAGHTSGNPSHSFCDELSLQRAKAVYLYLLKKGVNGRQMAYKGYGKRKPIATNSTPEGRSMNQRVEIKILQV